MSPVEPPKRSSGPTTPRRSEERVALVAELVREPLDLLVVGGGIVGAGVARDAAQRGLRVGLVEQHDFAFGTSSRSSRLLHGGLRYLAQGRLGLVREASLEKRTLHRIAPHLAQPLAFVFPTYRGRGWPLWQMRLGVKLYDLLCSGRNLGRSGSLSRDEIARVLPQLNRARLTGGVRYFDGLTNDARLVLDTLRSARRHGAAVLNYVRFENAARQSGRWVCRLADLLDGQRYEVGARAVVNATGPWAADLPHSQVKLRLSKGIHLVVPRDRLPVEEAVAITQGKRLLFVLPWGERLIIGTTDTDYRGPLEDVRAEPEDVAYVLQTVNEFFPTVALSQGDVLSAWAGLRPLIANADGTPSDISRAHQIRNAEPGWWDVAGGKLTTYRLMAEQTVDAITRWLRREARRASIESRGLIELNALNRLESLADSRTDQEELLPAEDVRGVSGVLPPEFCRQAVEHYCTREWAVHLADVMVRRTSWHYYLPDAAQKAERVADWMGQCLGWSAAEQAAELNHYRASMDSGSEPAADANAPVSLRR